MLGEGRSHGTDDVRQALRVFHFLASSACRVYSTLAKAIIAKSLVHCSLIDIHGPIVRSSAGSSVALPKMPAGNPEKASGESEELPRDARPVNQ